MLNAFVEELNPRNINQLASLKYIFSAGETLSPQLVRKFRSFNTNIQLENIYGPTEGTVYSSHYSLSHWGGAGNIPIGKSMQNIRLYILDKDNHLQPIGIPGQLYIGGIGLARGYLNRPQLTEKNFRSTVISHSSFVNSSSLKTIDNSSKFSTNDRLYKTGDLARWLPKGNIEYLGRIDHQVKIRGFRIELEEIESCLFTHENINETVVMAKEDGNGNKYLSVYFVSDKELSGLELREFLSRRLPHYMIPAYFVKLAEIPLTPNGKINRKSLPEPMEAGLGSKMEYCPPRNEIEEKLVDTWESVLYRKNIGIHENFFMIGGDSIKAIQIVSRMRKNGYKVSIQDIFRHRVIAELAPLVSKTGREADQSIITGTIPLTPIQEEFFRSGHIDTHHFNQSVMMVSTEKINKEIIRRVFMKIQQHHDALRMTYKVVEGEIIQTGHGLDYPFSLQEYDLRDRSDRIEALASRCNEIQVSIDLEKGPLMKLGLFHLDDGDQLLIVIHHLVMDGISWRILLEDVESLYRYYQEFKEGESSVLPLKSDSFKHWSEKLRQYSCSKALLRQLKYWREIENTPVRPLPVDNAVEPIRLKIKYTSRFNVNLSEEDTGKLLEEVHKAYNTEINDILLTALALAVNGWTGQENLLVSLEGHGREEIVEDIDISRTIGWFTSRFPVILQVLPNHDNSSPEFLSAAIKKNKERLRAIPVKGIGYGILRYLTPPDEKQGLRFTREPEISFNYLGQWGGPGDSQENRIFSVSTSGTGAAISPVREINYKININGVITGKRLMLAFDYNRYQYDKATMETLAGYYKTYLLQIINHCTRKEEAEKTPSDFGMAGLDEHQLETVYDALHDLFN